ncbi:hypothetical protein GOP47_0019855 [Adiantum capillus-veneris]|uniref:t-SNARE coiled-coil homology domain-containing protein n=1 Tax=Adiantum capillus-veneris TaxID=13818 RepID=A0A9D4UCB1_ADICA|nr:hypothetical protein GOP47_0019855 [Adiantum capillus-veneris]
MSDIFDGYERQYCELSTNLSRKCATLSALSGEQKKQKLSELNAGLDEAESLIRRMDLEARSLQPSQKSALLAKLREYKSDLNNLKKDVKKSAASSDYISSRDELLEAGLANSGTASADQRQRLLMSTDRINQTGDRIKDSKRVMLETEELGVSILQDLHQQRQTLLHATDTLHGVDDNLGKSKKILKNMANRMGRNKFIMGGLIALLLVVIAVVLYFKLR